MVWKTYKLKELEKDVSNNSKWHNGKICINNNSDKKNCKMI